MVIWTLKKEKEEGEHQWFTQKQILYTLATKHVFVCSYTLSRFQLDSLGLIEQHNSMEDV